MYANLDNMIQRRGLEHVGFVTLTFADNITDRVEAQRRFNSLATGFLRKVEGLEWIAVVERQGRGAIHYHLVMAFPWDIRTGFNFGAANAANTMRKYRFGREYRQMQKLYFASAPPALKRWWKELREAAKQYGFGRCETLPILSNAEGIARYVGSYVGKEFGMREERDKGLRTIRYSLDKRPWGGRWSFLGGGQALWRRGCSMLALILGTEDFAGELGKRWEYRHRSTIGLMGRNHDQCFAFFVQTPPGDSRYDRRIYASRMALRLRRMERAASIARKKKDAPEGQPEASTTILPPMTHQQAQDVRKAIAVSGLAVADALDLVNLTRKVNTDPLDAATLATLAKSLQDVQTLIGAVQWDYEKGSGLMPAEPKTVAPPSVLASVPAPEHRGCTASPRPARAPAQKSSPRAPITYRLGGSPGVPMPTQHTQSVPLSVEFRRAVNPNP